MFTPVIMPQMGESVAEGTVTKWLKKVGDRVERDEPLFEISTDKVDAEIPSPAAGVLTRILVTENQTVEVNAIVAEIDGEGGAAAGSESPVESQSASPDGYAGGENGVAPAAPSSDAEGGNGHKIRSSPLVRRIAQENQVDLSKVSGTGLGGRISKQDILSYLAARPAGGATPEARRPTAGGTPVGPQPAAPAAPQPPASPQAPLLVELEAPVAAPSAYSGPTQVVPMTPMRRQIAEHMVLSRRTSAHVTTVFEVEMTRVYQARSSQAAEFERRHGLKLTYTPFIVRAAVEALKQFPIFNASLDGGNVVYKRDVNIGIAVALETGLIVPVVKHADEKNFLGIARAVSDLAGRARSKRLNFDEVQGGTFTITNPGIFGSLFGTPIINQPQVAILGVGVIEKRAVVRDDAIAIRPMVYLMLSFDHRIIDGAMADQFVAKVKSVLEGWSEQVL